MPIHKINPRVPRSHIDILLTFSLTTTVLSEKFKKKKAKLKAKSIVLKSRLVFANSQNKFQSAQRSHSYPTKHFHCHFNNVFAWKCQKVSKLKPLSITLKSPLQLVNSHNKFQSAQKPHSYPTKHFHWHFHNVFVGKHFFRKIL